MHRVARQGRDDNGLARFGEPGLLVLLALSDGPKHGYAVTTDIAERTGTTLGRARCTARWPSWNSSG